MKFFRQLRAFVRQEKLDAEMSEEMRSHLELQAAENERRGLSGPEARLAAQRSFGGVEQIKERARDGRGWRWLDQAGQDMRHGARQWRKHPGFAVVVIFTLALAIGANTAVFSVVNAVLLQTLPVKNPEQLVLFNWLAEESVEPPYGRGWWTPEPGSNKYSAAGFPPATLEAFRANAPTLSDVFGFQPHKFFVDAEGPTEPVGGQFASGDYHRGIGVGAIAGRLLTADDDQPGAEAVAVISYRYWQRRFGGDPRAIGKAIVVNDCPVTIIGVTAPGFNGAAQVDWAVDLTLPLTLYPRFVAAEHLDQIPVSWSVNIMGRLKPGATPEQTRASLAGLFQATARGRLEAKTLPGAPAIDPAKLPLPRLRVAPGGQGLHETRRKYEAALLLLLGIVALVLLVACANVANLLLARGATRRREFAVRLALGAGRTRVVRQLLAESVLLAALGGLAGLLLAWWGAQALLALQPFGADSLQIDTPLDWRVLGFTSAVAVATGMVFGLAPALRSTRLNLAEEFQGGVRSSAGSRSRLAHAMMVAQVALSLVLLVGAGLLVRTLRNLHRVDVGFNREQLLLFDVWAPNSWRAPLDVATLDAIRERVASLPGVRHATYASTPPLDRRRSGGRGDAVYVPGHETTSGSGGVDRNEVDSSYLATLEIPLLRGRNFDAHDAREGAPAVAIVNQRFAQKYFGTEAVVGRRFGWGQTKEASVEIVGVMRDARHSGLTGEVPPGVLTPYPRLTSLSGQFIVRYRGSETAVIAGARAAIREINATLPLTHVRTPAGQIDQLFARERFFATLCSLFGALALLLAAIGLYGLISYQVLRRTGEIGVRMALGALPSQVLRMILRESLTLVALAVLVGIVLSVGATRGIASMLFGVPATDPLTYGGVVLLLLTVATIACLLPARRAANVDPMLALRAE